MSRKERSNKAKKPVSIPRNPSDAYLRRVIKRTRRMVKETEEINAIMEQLTPRLLAALDAWPVRKERAS